MPELRRGATGDARAPAPAAVPDPVRVARLEADVRSAGAALLAIRDTTSAAWHAARAKLIAAYQALRAASGQGASGQRQARQRRPLRRVGE